MERRLRAIPMELNTPKPTAGANLIPFCIRHRLLNIHPMWSPTLI
jgi:hypothetical protein